MLDDGVGAGEIVGNFLWPDERRRGAELAGDGGDLLVVGRDDDLIEQPRLLGRCDRVGDDRFAAKQADVLARDPLAAAARRDDRDLHARIFCSAATTVSCSSSVMRENSGNVIASS
jgi:hypothetical protein